MTQALASLAAAFVSGAVFGGGLTWWFLLRSEPKAMSSDQIQSLRVQTAPSRLEQLH